MATRVRGKRMEREWKIEGVGFFECELEAMR